MLAYLHSIFHGRPGRCGRWPWQWTPSQVTTSLWWQISSCGPRPKGLDAGRSSGGRGGIRRVSLAEREARKATRMEVTAPSRPESTSWNGTSGSASHRDSCQGQEACSCQASSSWWPSQCKGCRQSQDEQLRGKRPRQAREHLKQTWQSPSHCSSSGENI